MKTNVMAAVCIGLGIGFAASALGDPPTKSNDNIGHTRHMHRHNKPHPRVTATDRFVTSRTSDVKLPLPEEKDAFFFVVFGDRTGGPAGGVSVLADAVRDVNLLEPDLVMTVGDLIQGYNETPQWMAQMREFKGIMDQLLCPWFPVAGNHDTYWRGPKGKKKPEGEHDRDYEMHFGPLWYAFEHKNCWFIALYSDEGNLETGKKDIRDPECQRMSPEQYDWLAQTLDRAHDADHVFIFLHHPRWLGGNYGDDWNRVHELLVKAGNVSAVFAGHIHRARFDPKDGIRYVTLATVGGGQSGLVPAAGYLHHFDIVTVRKTQIALAALPVGEVIDVQEVTGQMQAECVALVQKGTTLAGAVRLEADGSARGRVTATVRNTTSRPIEVTLTPTSADSRWRAIPDHAHRTVQPGKTFDLPFDVVRAANSLDAAFHVPTLEVNMDYLAPGQRYPMPAKQLELPLVTELLPPSVPAREHALVLDGRDDHVKIAAKKVALPDGPLTLECWFRADAFGNRTGLVTKTEGSDYGIFVNRGLPHFSVFLGKRYVTAKSEERALKPGRWYHIAGEYDGTHVNLYLDGQLVATTPGSGKRKTNRLPLIVGADVRGNGGAMSHFKGAIDEVRLSSTARYTGRASTPTRRLEPDSRTALLLHMDGMAGPWLFDASPRGLHSRPENGAALAEVTTHATTEE